MQTDENEEIIADLSLKIEQLSTQVTQYDQLYKTVKHAADDMETLVDYCSYIMRNTPPELVDKLTFAYKNERTSLHSIPELSNFDSAHKLKLGDLQRAQDLSVKIDQFKFKLGLVGSLSTIDDLLPNEILFKIFKKLKLKDLCRVEQVNRRWRSVAKLAWSSFTAYSVHDIFNKIEEFYSINDEYDFLKIVRGSIAKIECRNIKSLRFSLPNDFFHHSIFSSCLDLIKDSFSNLTYLGLFILAGYQIENTLDSAQELCSLVQNCPQLQHIKINYTDQSINDEFMRFMVKNCPHLKSIKLCGSRKLLTCSFLFEDTDNQLDSISIHSSSEINELAFVNFFDRNRGKLKRFEFRFNENEARAPFHNMFEELLATQPQLEHLAFTLSKNFRLTHLLHTMKNLTHLDLSHSANSFLRKSPDLAKILFYCDKLRELVLTDLVDVRDDMFTTLKINAPLTYLNMRYLTEITDKSFDAISNSILANTLEKLDVSAIFDLQFDCVAGLVRNLSKLSYLDVSEIDYAVSNDLIEDIVANKTSKFSIRCEKNDLAIEAFSFYKDLVKRRVNANVTELLHDNLTIIFSNERRLNSLSRFEEDMYLYTQANILYRDDDF